MRSVETTAERGGLLSSVLSGRWLLLLLSPLLSVRTRLRRLALMQIIVLAFVL